MCLEVRPLMWEPPSVQDTETAAGKFQAFIGRNPLRKGRSRSEKAKADRCMDSAIQSRRNVVWRCPNSAGPKVLLARQHFGTDMLFPWKAGKDYSHSTWQVMPASSNGIASSGSGRACGTGLGKSRYTLEFEESRGLQRSCPPFIFAAVSAAEPPGYPFLPI
jgi:hypothetical protein